MAATREEVEHLLRKLFKGGTVRRIPKGRKEAEMFLALAASAVDSRAVLSEKDLNEQLMDWLTGIADPRALDHVTLRRYLVDFGMLFRDPEGHSYKTNQAVIARYIDADARAILPGDIHEAVELDRIERRRANS